MNYLFSLFALWLAVFSLSLIRAFIFCVVLRPCPYVRFYQTSSVSTRTPSVANEEEKVHTDIVNALPPCVYRRGSRIRTALPRRAHRPQTRPISVASSCLQWSQ